MDHSILTELTLVMAVSVAAAALLRRLHVPPVVGFIIAGVVIGPGGLGLVADRHQIEQVAEVGVVLLLFTIGLKLKLGDLWTLRTAVFGVGSAQVLVTGLVVVGVALAMGRRPEEAAVWGAMIALSSTALVLWLLEGTGDTGTRHGRTMVAVLLFQDLAVVPIMLALPLLAGTAATAAEVTWFLARSASVVVLTVVAARVVLPWVTARIVATGSRELFTLTTVLAAVGTALVFGRFGLSMALGAFLAGIVVSESEYVGRMVEEITPLRDVFNSLFFVSMGMLVDPRVWADRPIWTLGGAVAVMAIKAGVGAAASRPLLGHWATAGAVGAGLAQIGEFSVVVAVEARRLGVLDTASQELFLAMAVPTLIATPFLISSSSHLLRRGMTTSVDEQPGLEFEGHTVIVGYGVNGRNVARALRLLEVRHVVVELNPYTAEEVRSGGEIAIEGDARHHDVLEAAGLGRARCLVVAIPDAASTRGVVEGARSLNPEVRIIARTRFVREVEALAALGADEVIPEEFETSLELTGRVLELYGAPPQVVAREKAALRREGYGLLRDEPQAESEHPTLESLCRLAGVTRIVVEAGSEGAGRTLCELDLRRRTGVSVLAIERSGELFTNPAPDLRLDPGDEVLAFATAQSFELLRGLLVTTPQAMVSS